MLKSKHFKIEQDLLDWINGTDSPQGILFDCFRGIVKDVTNGDWIIFYIE